jgi:hypothetical protein
VTTGQEALSGLTDRVGHLLASNLLNQLWLSCLSVSFLRFLFLLFVPMSQSKNKKRTRPISPIAGVDGRDDAHEEGGDLVNSDDDAERTVSDPPLAMEAEGVVAESSARRKTANPLELDFRRAGLHLKAIKVLGGGCRKQARCASNPCGP